MNKQLIDVDQLPAATTVYQPKEAYMPDELMSFDVFLSLANGKREFPEVPPGGWLTLELEDVEDPNILDASVLEARLVATVRLQRVAGNHSGFEDVGEQDIDVTRDVLALDLREIKAIIEDFDDLKRPYLERLPGADAEALSLRHGGPTEVHLSVTDFFDSLGLLPDDAKGTGWVTEALVTQARKLMGVPYRHIMAYFQPQAFQRDCPVDIDGDREVDVTAAVLRSELERIHAMVDYQESVCYLVDSEQLGHDGPYSIRVTDSICVFFGVASLDDIDEDLLNDAREEHEIAAQAERGAVREFRLDAFDIVITVDAQGEASLTSRAHAESETEAFKAAIDAILDLVRIHAQSGVDVTAPAYVQGVKHAVENVWARQSTEVARTSKPH